MQPMSSELRLGTATNSRDSFSSIRTDCSAGVRQPEAAPLPVYKISVTFEGKNFKSPDMSVNGLEQFIWYIG
jgi:hypothetical protein